jgi:urease alpha subunit
MVPRTASTSAIAIEPAYLAEQEAIELAREIEMAGIFSKVWKKIKKPLIAVAAIVAAPMLAKGLVKILGAKGKGKLAKIIAKKAKKLAVKKAMGIMAKPPAMVPAPQARAELSPAEAASVEQMLAIARSEFSPDEYKNVAALTGQGKFDEAINLFSQIDAAKDVRRAAAQRAAAAKAAAARAEAAAVVKAVAVPAAEAPSPLLLGGAVLALLAMKGF